VLDCQWLQRLHGYGILSVSFRPSEQVVVLRGYLRQRQMLLRYAAQHAGREKIDWSSAFDQELEEAASVAGASWSQIMIRIILPLLATSFISGWIWVASQSMRNLSIPLMLSTRDSEVLSVVMWQKWGDGYPGQTAALGMMLILALAVIAVIGRLIAIRRT
jgi:ABC-type sulfate transport system permease component